MRVPAERPRSAAGAAGKDILPCVGAIAAPVGCSYWFGPANYPRPETYPLERGLGLQPQSTRLPSRPRTPAVA